MLSLYIDELVAEDQKNKQQSCGEPLQAAAEPDAFEAEAEDEDMDGTQAHTNLVAAAVPAPAPLVLARTEQQSAASTSNPPKRRRGVLHAFITLLNKCFDGR